MKPLPQLPGLQNSPPVANVVGVQSRPPTWPPPPDYPVVVDADNNIISRFSDPSWKVGIWLGVSLRISFGDGDTRGRRISRENADLFRLVLGYWLWSPTADCSPRNMVKKHETLKPLFVACSEAGILASELYRFPQVIEKVAGALYESTGNVVILCLNDIWAARETLGFTLLDDAGLKLLSSLLAKRNSIQTAYIPPRIWTYQVLRLKQCLDDFLSHQEKVEACYRFCVEAYAISYGAPHEKFRITAERFDIADLLDRWVNTSEQAGVKALSSYLSLISRAGYAYILNFALMRAEEGEHLRVQCHTTERDALGEDIHLIGGVTTKTVQDDDARWIVPASVEVAVLAMRKVVELRLEHEQHRSPEQQLRNPFLQAWTSEPWVGSRKTADRKIAPSYLGFLKRWPKLFDAEVLRITEGDAAIANRLTFGLDRERFGVGKVWPLAFHQLRRTGAVNMLASGQVSDASLQYQLKHASRAMTRYYGQNHYKLKSRLDDDTKGFYLREMYQELAREFEFLQADRFVSPHGAKRKEQLLNPISERDHKGLVKDATAGRVSYRETFLGGCTKRGTPCELGGISNITGCMGFGTLNPCEFALVDREKRGTVIKLCDLHTALLQGAAPGSRARDYHQATIESAERAINVIDQV